MTSKNTKRGKPKCKKKDDEGKIRKKTEKKLGEKRRSKGDNKENATKKPKLVKRSQIRVRSAKRIRKSGDGSYRNRQQPQTRVSSRQWRPCHNHFTNLYDDF